jgi:hypothetical protein
MQKTILFAGLFFLASAFASVNAQSIDNKSWKTYIGDPINDTVTFHIQSDSSFVTNSKGEVKVHNRCKITGDTLTVLDHGTEEMGCSGMKGVYKINLTGNSFTLTLIDDPCDGRSAALTDRKWVQTSK